MAWGRIALLHASEQAKEHINDLAETLGYSVAENTSTQKKSTTPESILTTSTNSTSTSKAQSLQAVFWKIQSITELAEPEESNKDYLNDPQKVLDLSKAQSGTYVFDSPEPMITSANLFPLILNALGYYKAGKHIDQNKLVKKLTQAKAIRRLPKQQVKHWPQQLTIIIDKHPALFPYWNDFDVIAKQLEILLGKNCVETMPFVQSGTQQACHIERLERHRRINGASVLLLTDLNEHNSNKRYWDWQELLQTLKNKGCQILSLSPAQSAPQEKHWLRLAKPQSLAAGLSRQVKQQGFTLPIDATAIETALTYLSPLVLVDAGLLRKLRLAFQWGNAALDGIIWNDHRIQQSYLGIRLLAEYREDYQQEFADLPVEEQKQFWKIVKHHHKHAYTGLKQLEAINQATLSGSQASEVIDYYQSIMASYQQSSNPEQQAALKQQLRTLIAMTATTAWQGDSATRDLLHDAYSIAYEDEIQAGIWSANLPNGLDVRKLNNNKTKAEAQVPYYLSQTTHTGKINISSRPPEIGQLLPFSSTATQPATLQTQAEAKPQPITKDRQLALPQSQQYLLTAENTQWQLKAIQRPSFAENIGQNQHGLFIETRLGDRSSRYYWHPENINSQGQKQRGFWFPDAVLAKNIKRDKYGAYQDIDIKGIIQRFRWIEAGQFIMGSPENEAGRYYDEDLHPVTLTQGFWLADTAVSQALWKAVTGKNPASFKGEGDNRPVENVSWEDATAFIKQLQKEPSLALLRLPYEAEWEYACRAGTQTPFSFGENITPKQVNYNGSYPYADGEKGLYRRKTVELKSLPPNSWGLYEMHGNVWEWCQDFWQEHLGKQAATNPKGVKTGSYRVLRGGSWFDGGRNVRSAYRIPDSPDNRYDNLGFRLLLGHVSQVQERASQPVDQTVAKAEPQRSGLWAGLRKLIRK